HHVRVASLANAGDSPALDPNIRLAHARPVHDHGIRNHTIERAIVGHAGGLSHAVSEHLAAAKLALVSIDRAVRFDFGNQTGVAQTDSIACGRAVQIGVMASSDRSAHDCGTSLRLRPGITGPLTQALPPRMTRAPAISTSVTVFVSPGSKRTAVPAGSSSRIPNEAGRANPNTRLPPTEG